MGLLSSILCMEVLSCIKIFRRNGTGKKKKRLVYFG